MAKPTTPFPWIGSKTRIVKHLARIADSIPHKKYVEVFGGSATLWFCKNPAKVNVYNDADERLADFFRVLMDDEKRARLKQLAEICPCSRALYEEAKREWINDGDIVKRAFAMFYVQNFSFGGRVFDAFGKNNTSNNKSVTYMERIKLIDIFSNAFKGATLESLDYIDLMKRYDSRETMFYVDPPYICASKPYRKDLPQVDHNELVQTLLNRKGSVVLSCYDNEVYAPLLQNGWNREQIKSRSTVSSATNSKEAIETIYYKSNGSKQQWLI